MAYSPLFGFNTTQKISLLAALDDAAAGTPATSTTAGTVKQGATVPAAAVPFASLTDAANAYNALRTSLRNAGIIA